MNVRCYTCNAPLAHMERSVDGMQRNGTKMAAALDATGIRRMCCRTAYIARVPDQHDRPKVDVVTDFRRSDASPEMAEVLIDCSTGRVVERATAGTGMRAEEGCGEASTDASRTCEGPPMRPCASLPVPFRMPLDWHVRATVLFSRIPSAHPGYRGSRVVKTRIFRVRAWSGWSPSSSLKSPIPFRPMNLV